METLIGIIFAVGFFALIFGGIALSLVMSSKAEEKRDKRLRDAIPGIVRIKRTFPMNQDIEEIVQGGLQRILKSFRELIVGKGWVYIQPTNGLPVITLAEDRNFVTHGLFAVRLDHLSPFIVVRNARNRSFLARYLQAKIKHGTLVWCEAGFDEGHNIFNEPDGHIDTLTILSPEVLQAMLYAPGNSDIILKKNQLYYIIPGNQPAETIVPQLLKHSATLARELNDNLSRWGAASANAVKLEQIRLSELGVTLRENYYRHETSKKRWRM